jgi:hypothetical protein
MAKRFLRMLVASFLVVGLSAGHAMACDPSIEPCDGTSSYPYGDIDG